MINMMKTTLRGKIRSMENHLIILMGGQSGKQFEQRLSILIKVVKKVKFLIIDEISMLPSDLFNRINANLVNALNHIQEKTPLHPCLEYLDSAKPFINLNLCLLGDFFQLPPPSGQSLALAAVRNAMFSQVQKFYKNKPSLVQYAQNGRNGGFLFTQFKRFTLNEQKRSLDPVHSKFIEGHLRKTFLKSVILFLKYILSISIAILRLLFYLVALLSVTIYILNIFLKKV